MGQSDWAGLAAAVDELGRPTMYVRCGDSSRTDRVAPFGTPSISSMTGVAWSQMHDI